MKTIESAGGVVLNSKGEVLIVNQRGVSWSLPKGHIEEGEDAMTAARREIYEETGIRDLELVKPLGSYERYRRGKIGQENRSGLKRITLFLFRTSQNALRPLDPDNPEARWVPKMRVAEWLTHEKDKVFFRGILGEL